MVTKQPTWREVAIMLGERMGHRNYCNDHSLEEADPDNCPFCHDRQVYRIYVAKKERS